jgi:multicomponent Na+:H+ antiporter subunit B
MNSIILRTAARYLIPLLFLFSIFVLFRGHNLPGGGFSGGLLAATGFALYVFAADAKEAKKALQIDPHLLMGAGLLIAMGSGVPGLIQGRPFLSSIWGHLGSEAVGTPIAFDIGVYLVVLGSALTIILNLGEE